MARDSSERPACPHGHPLYEVPALTVKCLRDLYIASVHQSGEDGTVLLSSHATDEQTEALRMQETPKLG